MPTIAMLRPVVRRGGDPGHRHVCCTNYHVIEGAGYSWCGGQRLDWEDKDVFRCRLDFHEHVTSGDRPAFLFSFTDAPVMRALDLYARRRKRKLVAPASSGRAPGGGSIDRGTRHSDRVRPAMIRSRVLRYQHGRSHSWQRVAVAPSFTLLAAERLTKEILRDDTDG